MTFVHRMVGAASLLVMAALVVLLAVSPSTTSAQTANPMQMHGFAGQGAVVDGDTVTAYIGSQLLGTGVVMGGGWVIEAQSGTNGSTVTFKLNGQNAAQTVVYQGFSAKTVTLTLASVAPTATPTPAAATGPGTFASPLNFGSGNVASGVFMGGTIEQLEAAVIGASAGTAWVQDIAGIWRSWKASLSAALAFLNNAFNNAFAGGLGTTAVFITR
ncbi:MAG: hypothetical protein O2798_09235 [Chloroflexi bacterium]|nr:hypothetical protein [Chloroflexota bacterium]MDA1241009.1 hypothetical protein [Chloroflexota bacterium]